MPKRKHPRLPNGYGSIKYLRDGLRNPWAVYPPVTQWRDTGSPISPPALAYVSTWQQGFIILTAYHAGTYKPGMDLDMLNLALPEYSSALPEVDILIDRLLSDFGKMNFSKKESISLLDVYNGFYDWKFVKDKSRTYSRSYINGVSAAFAKFKPLYNKPFSELTVRSWQNIIDNLSGTHESIMVCLSFIHQLYKYALLNEYCTRDVSEGLRAPQAKTQHKRDCIPVPMIKALWARRAEPVPRVIILLIYTGMRISEAKTCSIDLAAGVIRGGMKTEAGKNRIIPIHSAILPLLIENGRDTGLYTWSVTRIQELIRACFNDIGLEGFTAHYCRHTFASLGKQYSVDPFDLKRIMGHHISDLTENVYSHRGPEALRAQIEKIPAPDLLDPDLT